LVKTAPRAAASALDGAHAAEMLEQSFAAVLFPIAALPAPRDLQNPPVGKVTCRKTMVCEGKDLRLIKCRRVMADEKSGG